MHRRATPVFRLILGISCALAALLCAGAPAFAQDARPADTERGAEAELRDPDAPELIVPPSLIYVEQLAPVDVDAQLPTVDALESPRLTVPLPTADELELGEVSLPPPDLRTGGAGRIAVDSDGDTVYSTGELGVGTSRHIVGSISLYKLGSEPRFRFDFSHEAADGYNVGTVFKEAGSGYFRRQDSLSGWLGLQLGVFDISAEAEYVDQEDGLQGKSDAYFSTGLRSVRFESEIDWQPDPALAIQGLVTGGFHNRVPTVKTAETPPTDREIAIDAAVNATLTLSPIEAWVDVGFGLHNIALAGTTAVWRQGVIVGGGIEYTRGEQLSVRGTVAGDWLGTTPAVPFDVKATYSPISVLDLSLGGGHRLTRRLHSDLWDSFPLVASLGLPVVEGDWFGRFDVVWQALDWFDAEAAFELVYRPAVTDVGAFDLDTQTFPVFAATDLLTLRPSVSLGFRPIPEFGGRLQWDGNFYERAGIETSNRIDLLLDAARADRKFGGELRVRAPFYDTPHIPEINLLGFFQAAEGVDVRIRVDDVLAPLIPEGRTDLPLTGGGTDGTGRFSPFVRSGFRVTVLSSISL